MAGTYFLFGTVYPAAAYNVVYPVQAGLHSSGQGGYF